MAAADDPLAPASGAAMHRAKEDAAEWFALLRSGEATEADQARWAAWLAASGAHRTAWSYVERISRRVAPIQASSDPRAAVAVLQSAHGHLPRRRQVLLGLAAVGGTGLLSWATWRYTPLPTTAMGWMAGHRTGVGETTASVLADGTRAWLGSASAFNEDFSASLRRLHLVAGEVFIDTAADAARPFVVDTAQGRLRALGTRFNVRLGHGQTTVSVFEGAVEVRPTDGHDAAVMVVRAGQQARFNRFSVEDLAGADPAREAWIQGLLIAQDMPLAQVVAELARYRHGHLGVAPDVAGLRVYGSFPLDDTDRALAMLARALPIQVRQPLPWWRSIEARGALAGGAGHR